jgi:hypothetical protein
MKSATYARLVKNSREIVGVSTVTFGRKNEPTPYMPPPAHNVAWLAVSYGAVQVGEPVSAGELVIFDESGTEVLVTNPGRVFMSYLEVRITEYSKSPKTIFTDRIYKDQTFAVAPPCADRNRIRRAVLGDKFVQCRALGRVPTLSPVDTLPA